MKLLTLTLDNFQGIEHKEFNFEGRSASIYGDNATGKTTVFNALTWLLFDKASTGAKNFSPKRRDANGEIHNIENTVTADFADADGNRTEYRKSLHEIWKKKRGSYEAEYTGNTADYFINGIPKTLREYQQTISEQFGTTEQMMTLFMPDYFPDALGWQDRRRILLEVCGDVSDEEVIKSDPELTELAALLKADGRNYSVDDFKKIALARRTKINEQIETLPARIDEAKRAIPDIPQDVTPDGTKEQLELLEAEKATLIAAANSAKTDGDIDRKLSEINAEYESQKKRYDAECEDADYEITSKIKRLKSEHEQTSYDLRKRKEQIADIDRDIELYEDHIAAQDSSIDKVLALKWDESKEICPACKRPLPEEKVEALRQDFLLKQQADCEAFAASKEKYEKTLNALKKKKAEMQDEISTLNKDVERLSKELTDTQMSRPLHTPFRETEAAKKLTEEAGKVANEAAAATAKRDREAQERKAMLDTVNTRIDELNRTLSLFGVADTQKARIASLLKEEETLSAEFARTEQILYLCDEFIKTKVSMLDEKINGRFKNVHFRLFINQINGGVKDDCEVMIPSADGTLVPYTFANNAAKINAGLEIISVLSEYWNLSIPVVIDNAESVTHLNSFNTQILRLVVSEPDKTLRLELD